MTARVLHINKRYPPHVGGVERHVQDLARAQSCYPEVKVEVLCVAEDSDVARVASRPEAGPVGGPARSIWERDGRVAVRRVPQLALVASNPVSAGVWRELRQSGRRHLHDVWHFHYPFPTGEAALVAAVTCARLTAASRLEERPPGERRSEGRPRGGQRSEPGAAALPAIVCTYHSDFVGERGLKLVLGPSYAALTRRFLKAVDRVIVSSPQLGANSRFLAEVPDKVRVVPFGIDPALFRASPARVEAAAALRRRYGFPLLLFVGRLVPYKGVDVLLRAFASLPADVDARLLLVGDGPLRVSLETLAQGLGVAERVVFAGSLSDENVIVHYHAADVFVLPSVTPNEAFGLVQLEAHACGLPVVSTNLPTGVPFANADGISGLVVEPGDVGALAGALERLLRDGELRRKLGRRAQQRVEREFSLRLMTERVFDVYQEVLP